MTIDIQSRIAANLAEVQGRIAQAAARSGRRPEHVRLVAVTKYVGPETIRPLVAAGCGLLGENRPQHLWQKAEVLADLPITWHLIGHLQRNKVRRTVPRVAMIESVDSRRLVAAIDQAAAALGRPVPLLLEVNVSGEPAKHGFEPDAVAPLFDELPGYRHVEVRGLMCMARWGGGPDAARRDFAALRELRDRLRPQCPEGVVPDELSMGMSGDFEAAIEEGATLVRIGSALYRGVIQ